MARFSQIRSALAALFAPDTNALGPAHSPTALPVSVAGHLVFVETGSSGPRHRQTDYGLAA